MQGRFDGKKHWYLFQLKWIIIIIIINFICVSVFVCEYVLHKLFRAWIHLWVFTLTYAVAIISCYVAAAWAVCIIWISYLYISYSYSYSLTIFQLKMLFNAPFFLSTMTRTNYNALLISLCFWGGICMPQLYCLC